ncbi:hypothetical protein MLD38_003955 [Melastoma candidum]|uniref:Uncharacterized protein n=1 Tax=Melastoma candidum TaxID=119954 RepID=A0ACB9S4F9_9MYRT|nr:hypothetical protein MLD38_003955 [Melastoma candidum]
MLTGEKDRQKNGMDTGTGSGNLGLAGLMDPLTSPSAPSSLPVSTLTTSPSPARGAPSSGSSPPSMAPLLSFPTLASPTPSPPLTAIEWWKPDIEAVINKAIRSRSPQNVSDSHLINGHPGPVPSCPPFTTDTIRVAPGQTTTVLINSTDGITGNYIMVVLPFMDLPISADNSTATGMLHYIGTPSNATPPSHLSCDKLLKLAKEPQFS